MRPIAACAWCRRSKTKCVHDGSAPCRACERTKRVCKLTYPHEKQIRSIVGPSSGLKKTSLRPNATSPKAQDSRSLQSANASPHSSALAKTSTPVDSLEPDLLISATRVFIYTFPDFAFLHPPTFFEEIRQGTFHRLKMCAILALCARFCPDIIGNQDAFPEAGEGFARHVREKLSIQYLDRPDVETIQCLLMIGLYEWGACAGFQAWLYIGLAIRLSQALMSEDNLTISDTPSSQESQNLEVKREEKNRTIWCCFLMDQLLSCGKNRLVTLQTQDMKNYLPVSEDDYAFGDFGEQRIRINQMLHGSGGSLIPRSINHQFSLILHGVSIWAQLSRWVAKGARKASHGAGEYPWLQGSSWGKIKQELDHWRMQQDERVRYSPSRLAAQISRGGSGAFALINLTYYLCQIFLHREFIPFLPLTVSGPCGPIEAPVYEEVAPERWWENSAETLFDAAKCITEILEMLEEAKIPIKTPFVIFCAFTAATVNSYLESFPHMNINQDAGVTRRVDCNIKYLESCKELWKIAEGWHSTTLQIRRLYEQVRSNRHFYVMKGRRDYQEMEDSIQDYGSIHSKTSTSTDKEEVDGRDDFTVASRSLSTPLPVSPIPQPQSRNLTSEIPRTINGMFNDFDQQFSHQHLMSFIAGEELFMFDPSMEGEPGLNGFEFHV